MVTAGESVCDLRNSLSQWLECCCLEEHLTKGKYKSIAWCVVCSLGHILIIYIEVRASQLAQASERVGSLIPASQQG